MNVPLLKWVLALAARALKFARSVPLRLGVSRVRVPATALCPWVMRGDYPLGALKRRWLRSVVLRSPLGPWYALTGPGGIPSPNLHPCAVYLSLASELDDHA